MSLNQSEDAQIRNMLTDLFATFNITYDCGWCGRTHPFSECEDCEDDDEEAPCPCSDCGKIHPFSECDAEAEEEDEEPTEEQMEEDFLNAVEEACPPRTNR